MENGDALYQHAIEMIGRRWTGAIIRSLLAGNVRFTQIGITIPGLSDRLLSERLSELQTEGIVTRRVLPPNHVEYHLTAKGRALAPVVRVVSEWAEHWLASPSPEGASTGSPG